MIYFFLVMEQIISYNLFLYNKRKERKLSRWKFARYLSLSPFFYHFYEKGYLCPGKKSVKKISNALGIDFTPYMEGVSSYPMETVKEEKPKFLVKLLSSFSFRLILFILTVLSLATCITGYTLSSYTKNHVRDFYGENYLNFVDTVRERGDYTFSLLHEIRRPCIKETNDSKTAIIVVSKDDESLRTINAYLNYKDGKESTLYFLGKETTSYLSLLKVEYSNYETGEKLTGSFTREDNQFILSEYIYSNEDNLLEQVSEQYQKAKAKFESHLSTINHDFNSLIKKKTGLYYDFYSGLLTDQSYGAKKNIKAEIISLIRACLGVVLTGTCLFGFIYCFLEGENKKEVILFENDRNTPSITPERNRERKPMKKDIRFFPFIPETAFEIVGILLTFFGSLRRLFYLLTFNSSSSLNPNEFNTLPQRLFSFFTVGRFLLYFIDFDIFLEDRRSVRNIFLYGITFLSLYLLECTLVDYLSRTRGLVLLATSYYVLPNNFGTIACYFLIRLFLFRTPKWAYTKKRILVYRLLSLIPIAWIFVSTLIFQNYKAWGLNRNTWGLYFFNSERPQFSILCVSYLVGLYFLRLFYERKYGKENAKHYFNSNRFYFQKNILICLVICLLSLSEYLTRNLTTLPKGIGGYWQIIYLVPFLLFYHPHFGKRNKFVDSLTLILYFFFFGIGYLFVGLIAFIYFMAR